MPSRLLQDWLALFPAGDRARAEAPGVDLLERYAEPHRRYHDQRHLAEVLAALDRLTGAGTAAATGSATGADPDGRTAVALAAWFHDAVYDPRAGPGANERASATLARTVLLGLGRPAGLADRVATLVRATADHDSARADLDTQLLCDADLAILAADPRRYAAYGQDVRAEYAHIPEPAFRAGRAAILRGFADRPRIYLTPTGYAAWEARARANLTAELAHLEDARPSR